jgi:HAD superfamily hydrolase (TIGR02253 family)
MVLKAVFFDLDGTLIEDGDAIGDALAEACAVVCRRRPHVNAEQLTATYRQASETAWSDYDRFLRHLPSPQAMLTAVWAQTLAGCAVDDPTVAQAAADAYWQCRLRTCRPYADVIPLLARLGVRFHLSALTNGAPPMQRAKLTAAGLAPFFRDVFIGGEFPRGKPDRAIFHAALQAAYCQPEQAVHVGDSLVHDIAGARAIGIHSVWLNRKGLVSPQGDDAKKPDFEIASLPELLACLTHIEGGEIEPR